MQGCPHFVYGLTARTNVTRGIALGATKLISWFNHHLASRSLLPMTKNPVTQPEKWSHGICVEFAYKIPVYKKLFSADDTSHIYNPSSIFEYIRSLFHIICEVVAIDYVLYYNTMRVGQSDRATTL